MKKISIFIVFFILLVQACTNEDESQLDNFSIDLSNDQKELLNTMEMTSKCIGQVLLNKQALDELITVISEEYQGEGQLPFKFLFDDTNVPELVSSMDIFATDFDNEMKILLDELNTSGTSSLTDMNSLQQYIEVNNLGIYVPYYEDFDWKNIDEITVSYHPLINDSENTGIKYDLLSKKIMTEVTVNDEYAINNPSILIVPIENCSDCISVKTAAAIQSVAFIDDFIDDGDDNGDTDGNAGGGSTGGGGNSGGGNGRTDGTNESVLTTDPRNYNCNDLDNDDIVTVLMPEMRLTRHLDSGVFGGGSEVSFFRAFGTINFTPQPFAATGNVDRLINKVKIKRRDIKNDNWVSTGIIFYDDNWTPTELDQEIAVFDIDDFPVAFQSFTGTVGVMPRMGSTGTGVTGNVMVGFTQNRAGRGNIIHQNDINRCAMLVDAAENLGAGLRNGWQIRRAAGFEWYFQLRVRQNN